MATPSPRVRGEGRGEGTSPLGSDLRRSESRRGPLTLASHSRCFASAFSALRTASAGRLCSPRSRGEVTSKFVLATHLRPSFVNGEQGAASGEWKKSCSLLASRYSQLLPPIRSREAERRQTHRPTSAPAGAAPPSEPLPSAREARRGARLSAFHRGSCQRALARGLSTRPGFLGRGSGGRYPPLPVPVQWKHPTHRP